MSGGENQLVPLHSLSPDSLLIPSLMEEPLQPAHSNQLRSESILPHTHYLSLTVLCCSSHGSPLVCWKSQSLTLSYHLVYFILSHVSFLSCHLYTVYPPLSVFLVSLREGNRSNNWNILSLADQQRVASVPVKDSKSVCLSTKTRKIKEEHVHWLHKIWKYPRTPKENNTETSKIS